MFDKGGGFMWKKIRPYVFSIALAVGVGMLSGFLTRDGTQAFESIQKSPLTPPSVVFPIVWTILFALMGISAAMVYRSRSTVPGRALLVYAIQLVVNFFWSIIFFNLHAYFFAFLWLVLLWILILLMINEFRKVSPKAALLQVPYLLWVTFAGYLNFMVWLLNR